MLRWICHPLHGLVIFKPSDFVWNKSEQGRGFHYPLVMVSLSLSLSLRVYPHGDGVIL
jgi:hypothetical protein